MNSNQNVALISMGVALESVLAEMHSVVDDPDFPEDMRNETRELMTAAEGALEGINKFLESDDMDDLKIAMDAMMKVMPKIQANMGYTL